MTGPRFDVGGNIDLSIPDRATNSADLAAQFHAWKQQRATAPHIAAPAVTADLASQFTAWKQQRDAERARHAAILARNETGRVNDEANAPGRVMRGLSSFSDAAMGALGDMYVAGADATMPDQDEGAEQRSFVHGAQARTIGNVAALAVPEMRVPGGIVARLASRAATTGAANAGLQGTTTLAETGDVGQAADAAKSGFQVGAIGGAVMGGLGETLLGGAKLAAKAGNTAPMRSLIAEFQQWKAARSAAPRAGVTDAALAAADVGERGAGPFLPAATRGAIKTTTRKLFRDQWADVANVDEGLHDKITRAFASRPFATDLSNTTNEILTPLNQEQRQAFGAKLAYDNLLAEGERKQIAAQAMRAEHRAASLADLRAGIEGQAAKLEARAARLPASDKSRYVIEKEAAATRAALALAKDKPALVGLADATFAKPLGDASDRFFAHAREMEPRVPQDIETAPWFQTAVARYQNEVAPHLGDMAQRAGVGADNMRQPASAYLRLVSTDRAREALINRAQNYDKAAFQSAAPRGPAGRFLFGEKSITRELTPTGATGLQQGPTNPLAGRVIDTPQLPPAGATQTSSAKMAQGTAAGYSTDVSHIVGHDAQDKAFRAGLNDVYAELPRLEEKAATAGGPTVAVRRKVWDKDLGGFVDGAQTYRVSPDVSKAIRRFESAFTRNTTDESGWWRKGTGLMTGLDLAGTPAAATSHMNTLSNIVGAVPGEKGIARVIANVPVAGRTVSAAGQMVSVDFDNAATKALRTRLSQAGALRIEPEAIDTKPATDAARALLSGDLPQFMRHTSGSGGLVNGAHHALFGRHGVDERARLILAEKFLSRAPNATDEQLRDFVTSNVGNYVRGNSGSLVNALQDAGLTSFARFQAARIPTSIKRTFGVSDLPATSPAQRFGDVAETLWRGPAGYYAGADMANRALTGHSVFSNERGHRSDIQLPWYASPGGFVGADEAQQIGNRAKPLFLPQGTIAPLVAAGLRSTGVRDMLPVLSSRDAVAGRTADALRDVENTALGTLSPAMRALSAAFSGRTPYLQSDGSFLQVSPARFNKDAEAGDRVLDAIKAANPAFAQFAGEQSNQSLGRALESDHGTFGGPASLAAKVTQLLLPRVTSVGVGGDAAESSAKSKLQREYNEAMAAVKADIRNAPGPARVREFIDEAVKDAASAGYEPTRVRKDLEKYANESGPKRAVKKDRQLDRFERQHVRPQGSP